LLSPALALTVGESRCKTRGIIVATPRICWMKKAHLQHLSLAAVGLFILTEAAVASGYREFRDWQVNCSSALTCRLTPTLPDDAPFYAFTFSRSNAPDAPVELTVGFRETLPDASARMDIEITDGPALSLEFAEAERREDYSELHFEDDAVLRSLIEAMKNGTEMTVSISSDDPSAITEVSLSGVTASLLFIDESQDRLERTDALQAIGDREPPTSSPISAITSFDELPAHIAADFTDDMGYCGGLDDDRFAAMEGVLVDRGDEGVMLLLPCGLGGAYNFPYAVYIGGELATVRARDFPVMGEDGPQSEPFAYNIDFDQTTDRITSFFKGRGIGDCGTLSVWSVANDGYGPSLTLVEQRVKDDCDGDYGDGPDSWPLVWPAAQ
jgi:invasion protein IalB